ncbi:hypothetical protein SDC9_126795 [bioreactor metagenome]|uniref:Uncharacterized protein n=1 Tax=bioreactor metagenome TaxID=1076179 RepID=A0A645CS79_9ZZZZ
MDKQDLLNDVLSPGLSLVVCGTAAGSGSAKGDKGTGTLSQKTKDAILALRWFHMPRQARERGRSGIYHIMIKGINRQNIFKRTRIDRGLLKLLDITKLQVATGFMVIV